MRNLMKRILISAIVMILGFSSFGFGQKEFINVNGKKMEIFIAGLQNNQKDKPVIVFENGMATKLDKWKTVIEEVSKTSAVFSYNRPRIGESENDSLPPTTKHIVENLREMLLEKGFKPPYLLVSHSFGGAYIRSYASYYPDEIAGLIFVDPVDFTKKKGDGDLPYLEIGLTQHQIDSMFAKPYKKFVENLYADMPNFYVEEVKILRQLTKTEFKECDSIPLPDVPVHFIQAGGYPKNPEKRETIYDKVKLFRIDNNLKMKRWLALLNPLQYGKYFYCSNSGHNMQEDEPETVIASIKLALNDYDRLQKEKTIKD
ncbi:MAG: alpha/beta fold hydrolase [Stygiobacter sp.]|nr:MAG: alpha/beta fold hydrolase [Stygiobacter sp.]